MFDEITIIISLENDNMAEFELNTKIKSQFNKKYSQMNDKVTFILYFIFYFHLYKSFLHF